MHTLFVTSILLTCSRSLFHTCHQPHAYFLSGISTILLPRERRPHCLVHLVVLNLSDVSRLHLERNAIQIDLLLFVAVGTVAEKHMHIYAVSHSHESSFIAHTADLLSFRCHARLEFSAHLEGILRRRVEHFRFYSRSLGLFVVGARMVARCGHRAHTMYFFL